MCCLHFMDILVKIKSLTAALKGVLAVELQSLKQ